MADHCVLRKRENGRDNVRDTAEGVTMSRTIAQGYFNILPVYIYKVSNELTRTVLNAGQFLIWFQIFMRKLSHSLPFFFKSNDPVKQKKR